MLNSLTAINRLNIYWLALFASTAFSFILFTRARNVEIMHVNCVCVKCEYENRVRAPHVHMCVNTKSENASDLM